MKTIIDQFSQRSKMMERLFRRRQRKAQDRRQRQRMQRTMRGEQLESRDLLTSFYDFKESAYETAERESNIEYIGVVVERSGDTDIASSVDVLLTSQTATAGEDFRPGPIRVEFAAGDTSARVRSIGIIGDTKVEPDETFLLSFNNFAPAGAAGDVNPSATFTLRNDDEPEPSFYDFKESSYATAERESNVDYIGVVVERTGNTEIASSVDVVLTSQTATAGEDFRPGPIRVEFAAGDTSARVRSIGIIGDTKVEPDETFLLSFNNFDPAGAAGDVNPNVTFTLLNDDAPEPSFYDFKEPSYATAERESNVDFIGVVVERTGNTEIASSVDVVLTSQTATAGEDFRAGPIRVEFAAGATSARVTSIGLFGDTRVESDETFLLSFNNFDPNGAAGDESPTANFTLLNDDQAQVTISADVSHAEGSRLGETTAYVYYVTVDVEVDGGFRLPFVTNDGTATVLDGDYRDHDGSLTFVGETGETKQITVLANHDLDFEDDETFSVVLSAPTDLVDGIDPDAVIVSRGTATGLLGNDDLDPNSDLMAIDVQFRDLDGAPLTEVTTGSIFEIVLTGQDLRTVGEDKGSFGAITTASYDTSLIDVTALAHAAPFTQFVNGSIDDDAGQIIDAGGLDGLQQPEDRSPQDFIVARAVATGDGTLTLTTAESDHPVITNLLFGIDESVTPRTVYRESSIEVVLPQFSVTDASHVETNSGLTKFAFDVTLDRDPAVPVTIDFATVAGTAEDGAGDGDYEAQSGTLTFNPSGSLTQRIEVIVKGDQVVEHDETFSLVLDNAAFGSGIADGTGIGTIVNDDSAVFTVTDVSQQEGDAGQTQFDFVVSLSQPAAEQVSMVINTRAGTAAVGSDFVAINDQRVIFSPGETSKTLSVDVEGDLLVEDDEMFTVELSDPRFANATDASRITISDASGVATIQNDDLASMRVSDVSLAEGDDGTTSFDFVISIDRAASEPITVIANTADLTALAGSDYNAISDQLVSIEPGATSVVVSVTVNGDRVVEGDDTFELRLTEVRYDGAVDATRVALADASGAGVIDNDDQTLISVADVSKLEGDEGITKFDFVVSMSHAAAEDVAVSVNTADGTAVGGSDFNAIVDQDFVIPAGETSRQFTVDVLGDSVPELDEDFSLAVSHPLYDGAADATRVQIGDGAAIGTILADDPMMRVSVEFRDENGVPTNGIGLGKNFQIWVYGQDLRVTGDDQGAFGVITDVVYDTQLIDVTGIRHLTPFTQAKSGVIDDEEGLVDNAGGLDGLQQPEDRSPQEVLVLDAVARETGTLTISSRAGEDAVIKNLIFGVDQDVTSLTEFTSNAIQIGFPDLVATDFDVVSDHVLNGQATATVTIANEGTVHADAFEFDVIHSDDATIGNGDDLVIATVSVADGIPAGESRTLTVDLSLDVALLFSRAKADDPPGQGRDYRSTSVQFVGVSIDSENAIEETDDDNNLNQGKGVDLDDVTYFPWDVDSDGIVSGLDAIFVINRLGDEAPPADERSDLDGDGIVTGLDAIAVINRLGYLINDSVFEGQNGWIAGFGDGSGAADGEGTGAADGGGIGGGAGGGTAAAVGGGTDAADGGGSALGADGDEPGVTGVSGSSFIGGSGQRSLLPSQLDAGPDQDPQQPTDVDRDGDTDGEDAHAMFAFLRGERALAEDLADVNRDGSVTALDVLRVVNAVNAGQRESSAAEGESSDGLLADPGTWSLPAAFAHVSNQTVELLQPNSQARPDNTAATSLGVPSQTGADASEAHDRIFAEGEEADLFSEGDLDSGLDDFAGEVTQFWSQPAS